MQHNCSDGGVWPACYGRRRNDLPRLILFFVAAKENSTACYVRRRNDLPRPILISVAATMLLLQCDLFRLQLSRGVQAGTGCHKGRRSATCPCRNNAPRPIPTFAAAKKNGSACKGCIFKIIMRTAGKAVFLIFAIVPGGDTSTDIV